MPHFYTNELKKHGAKIRIFKEGAHYRQAFTAIILRKTYPTDFVAALIVV